MDEEIQKGDEVQGLTLESLRLLKTREMRRKQQKR